MVNSGVVHGIGFKSLTFGNGGVVRMVVGSNLCLLGSLVVYCAWSWVRIFVF
jgi:hypothetical protein